MGLVHRFWFVCVAGCGFTPGYATGPGGDDARTDSRQSSDSNPLDDVAAICPWPYTPLYVAPCAGGTPAPAALDLSAGTYAYNTDTGVLTAPSTSTSMPPSSTADGIRILWTTQFTLAAGSTLRATGSLPLLVISQSTIDVAGTLDVSSSWSSRTVFSTGAGANSALCPVDPPNAGQTCAQHGGSGGGGGGFGGAGGDGGEGGDTRSCDAMDGKPGGAGGTALAVFPATLRGGCSGRDGAQNDSGTVDRGRGGAGGGALQLVARDVVSVSGVIHAGGAGGTHGNNNRSGGGGGGTGGMIGLEATTVTVTSTGILAANGGGGGGGCDNAAATSGVNGRPSALVAEGGPQQGTGTAGGNGGFATTVAQAANVAERGGGGGGGGVGFITLRAATVTQGGTASPPPTP